MHRSQPAGCVAHVGGGVRDQPHRSSESSARPGGVLSPGPLLQGHRNAGTPRPGVRGPSSSLRGTAWKGKEEKLILEDMSLVQVLGLGLSSWVPLDAGTIQAAGTWD